MDRRKNLLTYLSLILRLVLGDPFTDKDIENQRDKELTEGHVDNYSLVCLLPFRYFLGGPNLKTYSVWPNPILLLMLLQGASDPAGGCRDGQFLGPKVAYITYSEDVGYCC